MRITITHNKPVDEIKSRLDRGIEEVFKGLPISAVEIADTRHGWTGNTLDFSFTAKAGFISVPIKGQAVVEEKLLTLDIELPAFVGNFIPEEKVRAAVEGQVKGLLA